MAVGPGQKIGADGTGNRSLGAVPVFLRLKGEQGKRAHDDCSQRRGLAVIDYIDPLAGTRILLSIAMEGEALDMDEGACDLQVLAAARMDGHPPVLMLHAGPRHAVRGRHALIAIAKPHGVDRVVERNQPEKLVGLQQQCHSDSPWFILLMSRLSRRRAIRTRL